MRNEECQTAGLSSFLTLPRQSDSAREHGKWRKSDDAEGAFPCMDGENEVAAGVRRAHNNARVEKEEERGGGGMEM